MSGIQSKVYEEGQKAYEHRGVYARNPYSKGSEEYVLWKEGYEQAFQDLLKDCLDNASTEGKM